MIIGERLRVLREERKLSQGDIEKRTGLLRCYLSRVENGHTVPAIETLEKLARALEMPLYQLLYDGDQPPKQDVPSAWIESKGNAWGSSGKDLRFMRKLRHLLSKMEPQDRSLLLFTVQQMAKKRKAPAEVAAAASAD
jgi:transcriptional regulator with XRE-family HTH domain